MTGSKTTDMMPNIHTDMPLKNEKSIKTNQTSDINTESDPGEQLE
jgi:hypothetical protein